MNAPHIVGIHIPSYKNLTDVWIPWSDGLTLVGSNGSGKTNILEALALLLAPYETLDRTDRVDTSAGAGMSILVRNDPLGLPLPPGQFANLDFRAIPYPFSTLADDVNWWRGEKIASGDTFLEAIGQASLPRTAMRAIEDAATSPLVQYTLQEVRHANTTTEATACDECDAVFDMDDVAPGDPCPQCSTTTSKTSVTSDWSRVFRRTLVRSGKPPKLTERPTHVWLSSYGVPVAGKSGLYAVLELPLSKRTPATLQWHPDLRTDQQARKDTHRAMAEARSGGDRWINTLGPLLLAEKLPDSQDAYWWADTLGREAANDELRQTAVDVSLATVGDEEEWFIERTRSNGKRVTVGTAGKDGLTKLSAGQRRWVDEALGSATRALRDHAAKCRLFTQLLSEVPQDLILEELQQPIETARTAGAYYGAETESWSPRALDEAIIALEPALISIARNKLDSSAWSYPVMRLIAPEFDRLRNPIVIRVFDEPEAHLHLNAVRRAAKALQSLRNRGQQVVVATHSPVFVDLDGWTTVHVRDGTVTPVTASALAADLGYSRGELLSGIAHVLVVEGPHDLAMLERFHGSQLRAANVAIIRMYGTNNLPNVVELDFIERYVDAPVTVILDYTRLDKVLAPRAKWDTLRSEEKKLVELGRAMAKRGQPLGKLGLDLPDVVAYLDGDVVRERWPTFPGWAIALRAFEATRPRPSFKPFLQARYGVDLARTRTVNELAADMHDRGIRPWADFDRKVNEFVASVSNDAVTPGADGRLGDRPGTHP